MDITIERADAGNSAALADAYLRLFNDAENLRFLSFTGIPFEKAQVENWFRGAGASGVEYYAAKADGGIAGIMVTRRSGTEGFEILGLVVDGAQRRRGAGGRMIGRAVERAAALGYRAVDMAVFADNAPMLALAIRNGFKPVRIEYRKRYDGEDLVWLKRCQTD